MNLLLSHIQYTSQTGGPRFKRTAVWPYLLMIGFAAGFFVGCSI